MIIFHGSDVIVEIPNFAFSRKSLDFGPGFYTTVNEEQAVEFARKVAIRRNKKTQFVNVYDFDEEAAKTSLEILKFSSPDRPWLEFVHQNRSSKYKEKTYDLVIGPVANDDVYATLIIYEQGILNIEQTIEALKIKKLFNQYVFKTEKSLTFLKFKNSYDPGDIS